MPTAGRPSSRRIRFFIWLGCLCVTLVAVFAAMAFASRLVAGTNHQSAERTRTQGAQGASGPASPRQAAATSHATAPEPRAAAVWHVDGPVADLSTPLPGMPPVANPDNIYADAGTDMLSPAVRGVPYRIYVPNSGGSTVTVIDPATYTVIDTYQTGDNPQHVVPAYNMRTLYATNDLGSRDVVHRPAPRGGPARRVPCSARELRPVGCPT